MTHLSQASRSHTHPSHSQTSRLLTSSLFLGVPIPRVTQCCVSVWETCRFLTVTRMWKGPRFQLALRIVTVSDSLLVHGIRGCGPSICFSLYWSQSQLACSIISVSYSYFWESLFWAYFPVMGAPAPFQDARLETRLLSKSLKLELRHWRDGALKVKREYFSILIYPSQSLPVTLTTHWPGKDSQCLSSPSKKQPWAPLSIVPIFQGKAHTSYGNTGSITTGMVLDRVLTHGIRVFVCKVGWGRFLSVFLPLFEVLEV